MGILPPSVLAGFTYEEQEQDWPDLLTSGTQNLLSLAEADSGEIVG